VRSLGEPPPAGRRSTRRPNPHRQPLP
jgi:hypothetical protein